MSKHRMAPKGAKASYVGVPQSEMQQHLNALQDALIRNAGTLEAARDEVYRLRSYLRAIDAIGSAYGPKDHISRLDGQAIMGHARAALGKEENHDRP